MQQETILVENNLLKSRKRSKIFDGEIDYHYQNKKQRAFEKETCSEKQTRFRNNYIYGCRNNQKLKERLMCSDKMQKNG